VQGKAFTRPDRDKKSTTCSAFTRYAHFAFISTQRSLFTSKRWKPKSGAHERNARLRDPCAAIDDGEEQGIRQAQEGRAQRRPKHRCLRHGSRKRQQPLSKCSNKALGGTGWNSSALPSDVMPHSTPTSISPRIQKPENEFFLTLRRSVISLAML